METKLIDGKQIAREIRAELKEKIKALKEAGKPVPKLVVILVGRFQCVRISGKRNCWRKFRN